MPCMFYLETRTKHMVQIIVVTILLSNLNVFREQVAILHLIKWPILSYRELAKVTNNFDQCNMLGKIGLEKVYYGKKNGHEVAIERYSNNEMHIFQQFLYEDLISNILPHKNLVSFHGCAFSS
ncbi:hypothetical protein AHAS_Ahas05G0232800 [Arachis hypogaea]